MFHSIEENNIILRGIVGSTAYGLATEDSDVDRIGTYAANTEDFHGLNRPKESIVSTKPDITLHEIGKYCQLAMRCNPTITELMWLPEELYEIKADLGEELISMRESFLSSILVRNAYLGYASQQFYRLRERNNGSFSSDTRKRTAKHARHLARLCEQGLVLYATGNLQIILPHPQAIIEFGERVGSGEIELATSFISDYESLFDTTPTNLPKESDKEKINKWLKHVREVVWRKREQ